MVIIFFKIIFFLENKENAKNNLEFFSKNEEHKKVKKKTKLKKMNHNFDKTPK